MDVDHQKEEEYNKWALNESNEVAWVLETTWYPGVPKLAKQSEVGFGKRRKGKSAETID